jgi:hypothetical protein
MAAVFAIQLGYETMRIETMPNHVSLALLFFCPSGTRTWK